MRTEKEIVNEYWALINKKTRSLEEERELVKEANAIGRRLYWMFSEESFENIPITESLSNRRDRRGLA